MSAAVLQFPPSLEELLRDIEIDGADACPALLTIVPPARIEQIRSVKDVLILCADIATHHASCPDYLVETLSLYPDDEAALLDALGQVIEQAIMQAGHDDNQPSELSGDFERGLERILACKECKDRWCTPAPPKVQARTNPQQATILQLPQGGRGRRSAADAERLEAEKAEFCRFILQIKSTLDFKVSSRGWCYLLENSHHLSKADFDRAQKLINDCRKEGLLPIDICADDASRKGDYTEVDSVDSNSPAEEAEAIVEYSRTMVDDYLEDAHSSYRPFGFWELQDVYVEMWVEKIDLKSLFAPVCGEFRIPIKNAKGWQDINERARTLRNFAKWNQAGKRCVLLHCGDFDPAGLSISSFIRSNLKEISKAVGFWFENDDDLIIDRFGLNYDFIEANGLTWIDNLDTGGGKSLADPKHRDYNKPYAKSYRERFGIRKCEANSLVVAPNSGRRLCREAITRYLPADASRQYSEKLEVERRKVRAEVRRLLGEEDFDDE